MRRVDISDQFRYSVRMSANTDITTVLGRRLRAARVLAGLDQTGIARLVGAGRSTVSNWENGMSEPQATQLARWAFVTDQTVDWLLEGVLESKMSPTGDSEGHEARPEGFEPPTFWSGVSEVS